MIAMSLAHENVCSAFEAYKAEFGLALEYNIRIAYKHQQITAELKNGRNR